jgi:CheY-like chemotaxis protein
MKVLIIDDEDDIRSVAALSLGILGGLEVVEADSGSDGVNKAAVEKPDVILLDMMMPGMDGPATLAALKSNNDTKEIPVIFLTARAMNNEVERLKQMGARGILTKPFDPTSLATQVRSILDTTDKDCNSVAIDKDKKGIPL